MLELSGKQQLYEMSPSTRWMWCTQKCRKNSKKKQ